MQACTCGIRFMLTHKRFFSGSISSAMAELASCSLDKAIECLHHSHRVLPPPWILLLQPWKQ
jgi:hypothetical protein